MVVGFAGGGTPGHLFMGGGVFRKKYCKYERSPKGKNTLFDSMFFFVNNFSAS